jgi:hypothetical protein
MAALSTKASATADMVTLRIMDVKRQQRGGAALISMKSATASAAPPIGALASSVF